MANNYDSAHFSIRVHLVRPFVDELHRCRGSVDGVLAAYDLRPEDMSDPDSRMPLRSFIDIQEHIAKLLGDPTLGLRLGAENIDTLAGPLSFALMASRSIRDALGNFSNYAKAMGEGWRMHVEKGELGCELTYQYECEGFPASLQDVDFSIANISRQLKRSLGANWRPLEIHLRHESSLRRRYEAILGCPVYFGQSSNCIIIEEADLNHEIGPANTALRGFFDSHVRTMQLQNHGAQDVLARVNNVISRSIGKEAVNIDEVAKALNMSKRSLQRAIADKGTSYRHILAQFRRATAESLLLRSGGKDVTAIALKTGYADAAVLSRAFKGWTGSTPRDFATSKTLEKPQ